MTYSQSGNINNNGSKKLAGSFQFESELITFKSTSEQPENCSTVTVMFDDISLLKK
jgi:hypothetical protein